MNTCFNRKKGNFVVVCTARERVHIYMYVALCMKLFKPFGAGVVAANIHTSALYACHKCTVFPLLLLLVPLLVTLLALLVCCVGKVKLQFIAINYKPSTTIAVTTRRCNTYTLIQVYISILVCTWVCVRACTLPWSHRPPWNCRPPRFKCWLPAMRPYSNEYEKVYSFSHKHTQPLARTFAQAY